jgi:alkanesulfonate monooxygenase SsuD/methylene tetrahydromethanopterin reductase-like flavin-dependent oxidoreductase (luciferase family)
MVQFGVHVGPQMCSMAELREVWSTAERLGFDWISVWDHFYPAPSPLDGDCFEGIACHAALAALTTRPRVGSLVYSTGYRHPAVLANAAATIDHLSDGRLELGLGAGWHKWEYEAYGIPFEAPAVRLRRMAESIECVRLLLTEDVADYDGEFFTLRDARCNPKPVQARPRIWVGASGEQIGLKLAGRHGDAWNVPFVSPEDFARKRSIVLDHAPDPTTFTTGVNLLYVPCAPDEVDAALAERFGPMADVMRPGALVGDVAAITDRIGAYVDAGAEWVILALRAPFDLDALERFSTEIAPAFTS